jgi:hypothetical protein
MSPFTSLEIFTMNTLINHHGIISRGAPQTGQDIPLP